jgi:hypothetical protein
VVLEVEFGCCEQMIDFFLMDRCFRVTVLQGPPRFDFDENQDITILGDQINFTVFCLEIVMDEQPAKAMQVFGSGFFTPGAEQGISSGHRILPTLPSKTPLMDYISHRQ